MPVPEALARRLSPPQTAMILRFASGPLPPPRGRRDSVIRLALVSRGLLEPCFPGGPRARLCRPRSFRLTRLGLAVAAELEIAAAATLVPSRAVEPVDEPLTVP